MFYSDFSSRVRDFSERDEGAGTAWSIMWTIIFLTIGGLAIDYTYALRTHEMLQSTADAASAAGAIELWKGGSVEDAAIEYAEYNMPPSLHGNVLVSSDVFVGTWNHVTKTFTVTNVNPTAVRVQTRRMTTNGNPLPTILLKFVGRDFLDVASASVSEYQAQPACLNGITANGWVNMASNNYFNDFCVHGYLGVDLQMGSTFGGDFLAGDGKYYKEITVGNAIADDGTDIPIQQLITGANWETMIANNVNFEQSIGINPGYKSEAAAIVGEFMDEMYSLPFPDSYQSGMFESPMNNAQFAALDQDELLDDGHYFVTCNGGQKITIDPPSKLISNVTIMTTCKIHIGQGVTLSNVDLLTTKTGANTVTMASDVTLGGVACNESGEVTDTTLQSNIISMGDIHTASGFSIYGSKIISAADIHFAAKSGGINGASIQADGDVFLASQGDYSGGCKVPLTSDYTTPYFRLVY